MDFIRKIWSLALTIILMSAWGFAPSAYAEPNEIESINAFLTEHLKRQNVPGAVTLIFNGDVVSYENAYGFSKSTQPVSMDTTFALGSITKSFTALVILQLEAEGKLGFNQPISEFSAFADVRSNPTVLELLTHTSGFSTAHGNANIADTKVSADALRTSAIQLLNTPDVKSGAFAYSNANYQILGALIEHIDKQTYEEAVTKRILIPLGMTSSFVRETQNAWVDLAVGHRFYGPFAIAGAPKPGTAVTPQSAVYASAPDMMKYLNALGSDDPRILPPRTQSKLWDISSSVDYGAGWFVRGDHNDRWLYHGGMNAGFKAEAGFHPASGRGFVILTNASDGWVTGDLIGVTEGLRNMVMDDPVRIPGFPKSNWASLMALVGITTVLIWLVIRRFRQMFIASNVVRPSKRLSAMLLGLIGLCAYGVPQLLGIPLSGIRAFRPDAGTLLISIIALSAVAISFHALPQLSLSGQRDKECQ